MNSYEIKIKKNFFSNKIKYSLLQENFFGEKKEIKSFNSLEEIYNYLFNNKIQ